MIKFINAIKPDINNNGTKNGVIMIIKNMIAKNNIIRVIKLTICVCFSCGSRTRTYVDRLMRPSWEPPPVYSAMKKETPKLAFFVYTWLLLIYYFLSVSLVLGTGFEPVISRMKI